MPNRILKESICVSDSIDRLSWFEEVLFYRLIVNCDDYGRFDGRIGVIKSRLFPLKDDLTLATVKSALVKLVSAGLVITYENMGKPFLYLPTWSVHQNVRAKKSKYPSPDGREKPIKDSKNPPDYDVISSENICRQMISDVVNCEQMQTNVPVIQSNPNPIQSVSEYESKSENSRSSSARDPLYDQELSRVMTEFQQYFGINYPTIITDELINFCHSLGADVCIAAIHRAIEVEARNWKYVKTVLSNCERDNIRSLADWEMAEARRNNAKKQSQAQNAEPENSKWDNLPGITHL